MRALGLDGGRILTICRMYVPMDIFTNISRYGEDQRLKFGHLTVFGLPEPMTGSDHDLRPHINRKNWKNELILFLFSKLV